MPLQESLKAGVTVAVDRSTVSQSLQETKRNELLINMPDLFVHNPQLIELEPAPFVVFPVQTNVTPVNEVSMTELAYLLRYV